MREELTYSGEMDYIQKFKEAISQMKEHWDELSKVVLDTLPADEGNTVLYLAPMCPCGHLFMPGELIKDIPTDCGKYTAPGHLLPMRCPECDRVIERLISEQWLIEEINLLCDRNRKRGRN